MERLAELYLKSRIGIIIFFSLFSIVCAYYAYNINFAFSFEQFFPKGDPDLEFFNEFIKDFESDDNFLMVAIDNGEDVFEKSFLNRVHRFSLDAKNLPHVTESKSLTQLKYPIKSPFGISTVPIIHLNEPAKYDADKRKILQDPRFVGTLIDSNATSIAITLKNKDQISLEESKELIDSLEILLSTHSLDNYHLLGRAYFQDELVEMQIKEIRTSTVISVLLVLLIMYLLYRKPIGVFISLSSIGLGLLVFLGVLSMLGKELNAMSALYPVLMLIVGTSDVIHIMTKYTDTLKKGLSREESIIISIKEIGMATLLTSLTTAAGFLSLATSKVELIKEFGANSALGVMIAYVVVILLTTSLLSLFKTKDIMKESNSSDWWDNQLDKVNHFTVKYPVKILAGGVLFIVTCLYGMSIISTNYKIENTLPLNSKITADFKFFEEKYAGFRPIEFAIFIDENYSIEDYEVIVEMDKLEKKLKSTGKLRSIMSITDMHKSVNRMYNANRVSAYKLPTTKAKFNKQAKVLNRLPLDAASILVSKDSTKARISTRVIDIGADSIKVLGDRIDRWIADNIDSDIITIKRTGTGLIVDKNAKYISTNLLQGLGLALGVVSLLMMFLFRNIKMLVISLIPNMLPLLFAAAVIGYAGIELDAGISIIFAIIFGIAVDDTIHFLGKYKLAKTQTGDTDKAIAITFRETGKAIIFTSIILFFGFLVMLFSNQVTNVRIGLLISITLVTAVVCDLLIIPVLIRKWLK